MSKIIFVLALMACDDMTEDHVCLAGGDS